MMGGEPVTESVTVWQVERMPANIPGYCVEVGLETKVWRDGQEVVEPPTSATVALLNLLAEAFPQCVERKALARKLYPLSTGPAAMNALRQTVFRLRHWLGPESVRTEDRTLGLETSLWRVSVNKAQDEQSHDWSTGSAIRDSFKGLVYDLASLDADAARSLFLGGKKLAESLPLSDLADLLKATRPNSNKDEGAIEHMLYHGRYYHQTVQFSRAEAAHMRVFRLATQSKRHTAASTAAAWLLFTYVEKGDFVSAKSWLSQVVNGDRTISGRLFAANAKACYLWNTLDRADARDQFDKASRLLHHSSASDQAHYWANYAVFAAETGDIGLYEDCAARAKSLAVPGIDMISEHNILLANAIVLRGKGEHTQSINVLETLRRSEAARGHTLGVVYEMETAAETYAAMGHKSAAIRLWNEAETLRFAGGGKLTPRLQAMKSRIKSLTA